MDLKGKYKDVPTQDLVLMVRQMIELTPEDKEEIMEIHNEISRRKDTK
jgi:hypothetical protein